MSHAIVEARTRIVRDTYTLTYDGTVLQPQKDRDAYIRSTDGSVMVEIAPHVYVNHAWAKKRGLI